MSIIIYSQNLQQSLDNIQFFIKKSINNNYIENMRFITKNNKIIFYTNDSNICIKLNIKALVKNNITTIIPIFVLYSIINKFKRNLKILLRFIPNNNPIQLIMELSNIRFSLPCIFTNIFQDISNLFNLKNFNIYGKQLYYLLNSVSHAIPKNNQNSYIIGALIHTFSVNNNKKIRCIATDGYRLASSELLLYNKINKLTSIVIPKKIIDFFLKSLRNYNSIINVYFHSSKIIFKIPQVTIISKLIYINFPNYKKILSKRSNIIFNIDKKELKKAINIINITYNEKNKIFKFSLRKKFIIISNNNNKRSTKIDIKIYIKSNQYKFDIFFNLKYFLDILNSIKSKYIHINFKSNNEAIMIRENSQLSKNFFILMPIQIN